MTNKSVPLGFWAESTSIAILCSDRANTRLNFSCHLNWTWSRTLHLTPTSGLSPFWISLNTRSDHRLDRRRILPSFGNRAARESMPGYLQRRGVRHGFKFGLTTVQCRALGLVSLGYIRSPGFAYSLPRTLSLSLPPPSGI